MISDICKSFKLLLLHKNSFLISGKITSFLFLLSINKKLLFEEGCKEEP